MFYLDADKSRSNKIIADTEKSHVVTDAQKDPSLLQRLDYETWLPFAAKVYEISPNISDYLLVVTPICPATIPNRNGIAFPLESLIEFRPPPVSRMAYKAWAGCPVHYNHQNEVHKDAYGVILDASLHKITTHGNGKLWKVMGLLAISKTKYRNMAQKVANGEIDTYSMGAYVDRFFCSYCNAEITDESTCRHIKYRPNEVNWERVLDSQGNEHVAFINGYGLTPIETSIVPSPAWAPAQSDVILTLPETHLT